MDGFTKEQTPECGVCRFKTDCFYSKLGAEAQKAWTELRLARKFRDEEDIYSESQQPQGVYTVCKGRVKIYSTDAKGQQMITWIRHPGETFGHIALFSEYEYSCSGRAMGLSLIHI